MKAPLSINPEQTPGFSQGKVEGLIFTPSCGQTNPLVHRPNTIHGPINSHKNPPGSQDQSRLPDDFFGSLITT